MALKSDSEVLDHPADSSTNSPNTMPTVDDAVSKNEIKEARSNFHLSVKETVKAALINFIKLWQMRPRLLSVFRKHGTHIIGNLWVSKFHWHPLLLKLLLTLLLDMQ